MLLQLSGGVLWQLTVQQMFGFIEPDEAMQIAWLVVITFVAAIALHALLT
ncbi:hypothetical protein AB3480_27005 [Rhizobium mongolense]